MAINQTNESESCGNTIRGLIAPSPQEEERPHSLRFHMTEILLGTPATINCAVTVNSRMSIQDVTYHSLKPFAVTICVH